MFKTWFLVMVAVGATLSNLVMGLAGLVAALAIVTLACRLAWALACAFYRQFTPEGAR